MADKRTLKSEFDNADARRSSMLERARECAELTLPSVLPRAGQTKDAELVRPYQSLGAYGSTNLTNKLLLSMVPVGVPWFQETASARIRGDAGTTPESLTVLEAQLYFRDLLIRDQLEAARLRTRYRTSIEQVVILGNTLSMMTDDYTIKTFRLDQYVQKRSTSGLWQWIITHETLDPAELTEAQLTALELTQADLDKRDANAEGFGLYTKCTRQRDGGFVIQQEINGKELVGSEEPISRYFPAGYVELPGEDYSRGFIEERLGALRSLNGLTRAILDAAVASSKIIWVVDEADGFIRPEDMLKPSGSVITGRVMGAIVDKVACIQAQKFADMQVAFAAAKQIGDELSSQMLIESAVQPEGERVTAYQVNRIARELEGATGGIYSHIAEEMQVPLVKYTIWKMEKENKLPSLPAPLGKEINVEILTGLEAMGRQREAEKIQALIPLLQAMPDLGRYIKPQWLLTTVVRGLSIDPTHALKSKEEMDAEQAQQAEQMMKMQLAQTAMQTGGKVIQDTNKAQAQAQAAPPARGQ